MLQDKVLNTIEKNSLIPKGCTVIAAVSGGADSVCLLDVLHSLKETLSINIECAHLNHCLRGEESDTDEKYVRFLCNKYGIKLHVTSVDIKAIADGKSIEDVARNARYEFFDSLCKDGNTFIATAHTVNDNTETFFINLIRGSGSRGLCSIPIKRDNIIRPLLDITRKEIIEYLAQKGIDYRTDSTNADTAYLRNFIRHEIIPVFEKRQDINIFKSVCKATQNLTKENQALDTVASAAFTNDIEALKNIPDAVLYRIINNMLETEYSIILDSIHFDKIKDLIFGNITKIQIKDNIFATNEKGKLFIRKFSDKDTNCYPLSYGENRIGSKTVLIKNVKEVYKDLTKNCIDCDKINGNIFLRSRREGDSFNCISRKCSKKLTKMLKNDGLNVLQRDSLAVICDETDKVVFVEGYGANADVQATNNSKNILSIEIISGI